MKKSILLFLLMCVTTLTISYGHLQNSQASPISEKTMLYPLGSPNWKVNANSFEGQLVVKWVDNKVKKEIEGSILGTPIKGKIEGRKIVFTKQDDTKRVFTGYYARDRQTLAGTFSHKNKGTYPWFAIRQN